MTCDLLGSQEVGLGAGAVHEDDACAPVEVGGALEAVEGGERGLVDRVQLADDRVLAAGNEAGVRAEVVQLESRLGPRLADQPRSDQVPVVALAEQESAVDEDERARLKLALPHTTRSVARATSTARLKLALPRATSTARLALALSRPTWRVARGHDATPTAVVSGSTSKPRRSYAFQSTRK